MKICGVELKSNQAIFVIIDTSENNLYIESEIKRITLENDDDCKNVKSFFDTINTFFRDMKINKIYIKKRAKNGTYVSSPDTFKIEGLIQINTVCHNVHLVSAQALVSFRKQNNTIPDNIRKYQEEAFSTAMYGARNSD